MIQYNLRDPDDVNVLVFLSCVLSGEIAALCAIILDLNLVSAIILGLVIISLILIILKVHKANSYTTVTYLDEDDVERIRAQLNTTEKEAEA